MIANKAKYLRYTEEHFEDYMVQLTTFIRANEYADQLLDGFLPNPIKRHFIDNAQGLAQVSALFTQQNETWPPTEEEWLYKPIQTLFHALLQLQQTALITAEPLPLQLTPTGIPLQPNSSELN